MKNRTSINASMASQPALEARLAMRVAAALTTNGVTHDAAERLRIAREQAVAVARRSQPAKAHPVVQVTSAGAALLGGLGGAQDPVGWPRWLASLMPLLVLLAGLIAVNQWTQHEQVLSAAEIDTLLLSDQLPPAAYADPGFAEYLRSGAGR
jgi:hypothetical protein